MIIDDRLNFKGHVKFIGKKISVIQGTLTRMMPNIGEPNSFERRLLYACPIWLEALSAADNKEETVLGT